MHNARTLHLAEGRVNTRPGVTHASMAVEEGPHQTTYHLLYGVLFDLPCYLRGARGILRIRVSWDSQRCGLSNMRGPVLQPALNVQCVASVSGIALAVSFQA